MLKRVLIVGVLVVSVVVVGMVPALAQDPIPFDSPVDPPGEWPPVPDADVGGLTDFVGVVGIGALITVVIEILKQFGLVPDGQAGRWATLANIVAFAGLAIAGVFGVDYSGDQAKAIYDLIYRIGQAILMIISSPVLFKVLRGANVFPAYHSE